jgi:hypothetical protein
MLVGYAKLYVSVYGKGMTVDMLNVCSDVCSMYANAYLQCMLIGMFKYMLTYMLR